ncbi:hypothetical protein MRX96_032445 [Rhipicephalus microplus]
MTSACSTNSAHLQLFYAICLASGDLADVELSVECLLFLAEQATFQSHQMTAAVQKDVFRAAFYGNFTKEERIVITDLHPGGFRGLLQ